MKNILYAVSVLLFMLVISCQNNKPDLSPDFQNSNLNLNSFSFPLYFEENIGQIDDQIKYFVPNGRFNLFLKANKALFEFKGSHSFSIEFLNANSNTEIKGLNQLQSKSNYFIGSNSNEWKTNISHYQKVGFKELYSGIDMEFYSNNNGNLEFDFMMKSGIDPNNIKMSLDGVENYRINNFGDLDIYFGNETISIKKPKAYQEINNKRVFIDAEFISKVDNQLCFKLADYDTNYPLVIDPEIEFSTFIGYAQARAIDVDKLGNVYLTGITDDKSYPIVEGAVQPELTEFGSYWADYDVYISKLNSDGTDLIYSTFIGGGKSNEDVFDIAVDENGCAHITGVTYSDDFPVTEGAFKSLFNDPGEGRSTGWANLDAYILKLDSSGSSLKYSTFLGGEWDEFAFGIDLDKEGYAYVSGVTFSEHFPTTEGAYQDSVPWAKDKYGNYKRNDNAFVTKMNLDGTAPIYSTYLGYPADYPTSPSEYATDIAVDKDGNAYITGYGILQGELSMEIPKMFIAKLNSTGSSLVFSKQIADAFSHGITVDKEGNSYITGEVYSWNKLLPITDNAFNKVQSGSSDAYFLKLDAAGSTIQYCTYIGGNENETGFDVKVDSTGIAYITGNTGSGDLITKDAIQEGFGGGYSDGFVVKIDPTKNGDASLIYSTYLGGSSSENLFGSVIIYTDVAQPFLYYEDYISRGAGIAVDKKNDAYIFGSTYSVDFPITEAAYDTTTPYQYGYQSKTFVTKIGKAKSKFYPHGVAYDPINWDKDVGELQSTFSDLSITGQNLLDVDSVIFLHKGKKDVYFEAKNIRTFTDSIAYDLIVVHGSELGYRDIKLKTKNGQLIDVTDEDNKFIVSRVRTYFNQAIDQNLVSTHFYRDILVSNKAGMVRLELDDPSQLNRSFDGKLRIEGVIGDSLSLKNYTYTDSFTDQEIMNFDDYMIIPFPRNLNEGEHTFTCRLYRGDGAVLYCPNIKRNFIESAQIKIWLVRYQIAFKEDGTLFNKFVNSVSREDAEKAVDYLKKVYPLSDNQISYLITDDIVPSRYGAKELKFYSLNVPTLSERNQENFHKSLERKLIDQNSKRSKNDQINVLVAIMPEYSLYIDKNGDGDLEDRRIDEWIAGFTTLGSKVIFITPSSDSNWDVIGLGGTLAHELGHRIYDVALSTADFEPSGNDLMDEYRGGNFDCDINPPIKGNIDAFGNISCSNSPFIDEINGDSSAVYTDLSAFDILDNKQMITYFGISDTVKKYNFMGSAKADSNIWVSLRSYDQLLMALIPQNNGMAKANLSNQIIEISGNINQNGETTLNPISISNSGFPSPNSSGPYQLQLHDNSGNILVSHNFDVSFMRLSDPPSLQDYASIFVRMEKLSGTNKVLLFKDNNLLASQILSENAPKVEFTNLLDGETTSLLKEIKWKGSDEDGDKLSYSLYFENGEQNIISIVTDISDTSFVINNPQIKNANGDLHVLVTDGYNYGSDSIMSIIIVNVDENDNYKKTNKFYLEQNYPNPFNPNTNIKFGLAVRSKVYLALYNLLGEEVITLINDEIKNAGTHEISISGNNLSSGIYFLNLKAGDFTATKKIVLIK